MVVAERAQDDLIIARASVQNDVVSFYNTHINLTFLWFPIVLIVVFS